MNICYNWEDCRVGYHASISASPQKNLKDFWQYWNMEKYLLKWQPTESGEKVENGFSLLSSSWQSKGPLTIRHYHSSRNTCHFSRIYDVDHVYPCWCTYLVTSTEQYGACSCFGNTMAEYNPFPPSHHWTERNTPSSINTIQLRYLYLLYTFLWYSILTPMHLPMFCQYIGGES